MRSTDQFNHDKHYLSNLLNNYTYLLLFPKTLCIDLKQYGNITSRLSRHMNEYNLYLLLLRKYHKDIKKLKRFGYIFNTYSQWERCIRLTISWFLKTKHKLISSFYKLTAKEQTHLKECNVYLHNLVHYMDIQKMSTEYLIPQNDEVYKIDYLAVIELLPKCSITNQLYRLDKSDIIAPVRQNRYY
jgi:hypothetical protein